MQYLKSKQYYIDLYDQHTVERCRRLEEIQSETQIPKDKKISKRQVEAVKKYVHELMLTFEKGERYLNKEKTINEWMERDRQRDELLESAQPPEDIRCLTCRNRVAVLDKHLWDGDEDKPERVLFMFECPNKCLPRRAFFNDGEERRFQPHLCVKCANPTKTSVGDTKKKIVTIYTCLKCKHIERQEYVWSKAEDEYDEHFAKDRDRFCLTDEKGREFQDLKWNMEQAGKFMEEWEEKEKALAKKLEENPQGFHLDGVGYTCAICRDNTPEGDNWYDQYGIKCLVCQKAIDKKEIPASLAKDEYSWYTKHDFDYYFNVKGPTLQKWIRQGILKTRSVSHYGEGVHTQLFLIKDNKDFLPPKKLLESRMGKEIRDGKEWRQMHPWYHFGDPRVILKGYKIMDHLRVVSPEEVAQREEEMKAKEKARRLHREKVKSARQGRKKRK